MLRRAIQLSLSIVVMLAVLLFGINYLIRVSDGVGNSGIIEQRLFGRSAWSAILRSSHSDAFNHWDDANEMSARLASLLSSHGSSLATDSRRAAERELTAREARGAYEHSTAVPHDYVAASNPGLPAQYKGHFVEAMRLYADGLDKGDQARVREGMEHYNAFLNWIQRQDRDDFKQLK